MCTTLIIFAAFVMSSSSAVLKTSEPNESVIVEAVVQILESCYKNGITAVGLAGNSTGMISQALMRQGSSLITLFDGTARKTSNVPPVYPQSRYRLQVFVITASSAMNLSTTLNKIKASIWWNHMASFLVLEEQLSERGCNKPFEMLWTTWEMNLLNVNFLCQHGKHGRLIYTFNPYTNWAPEPWQLKKSYGGKNGHPWSLFVRRYEGDSVEGVCKNLNFEKANDLGGYQIRVSSTSFGHELVNSDRRLCPGVIEDIICEILFPALNATPNVLVHGSLESVGFMDEKGNINGILGEVVHGLSDITVMGRFLAMFTNLTMIYPHYQCDLRSLTHYSGYKSQLSKIRSVIDSNSRYSLYLVCVITVLFFKCVARHSLPVALLSTLRIICNSSLPKISGKLGPRIYFGSLFLFAITMQGIYQGQLASLLTKQKPLRNVDTMTDLAELDGYTIYGQPTYGLYFGDAAFEGRYVGIKSGSSTDYVLDNPRAACIGTADSLVYDATKYRLHMSQKALAQVHMVFPIRPDWPLEQRVNSLIQRAVEAHIIHYAIDNVNHHSYRLLKLQENQYKDQSVKTLTLKQLAFAFAILGIGLGIATITFVIEVFFG